MIRPPFRSLSDKEKDALISEQADLISQLARRIEDNVVKACRMAGFEPAIGQPAPQIASILSLVSAELGVALVPQSPRQFQFPDVVFKTLSDVEAVTSLGLVHSRQNRSMSLRIFVGLAIQQIEKSGLVSSTEQGA